MRLFQRGQTLREFVDVYRRDVYPSLRANTIKGYDLVLARHVLPTLGDLRLEELDQRVVQDWINDLAAHGKRLKDGGRGKMSPRTVESCFAVLSTVVSLAAEYGLAAPIPRSGRGRGGVRLPKKLPARKTIATPEQIYELGQALAPDAGPAFAYCAGFCGLRISEIFGLAPSAVDFHRHRIHVRRTKEQSTGLLVDLTKNGKDRYVTMTLPVEDAIRAHLEARPHPDLVFHRRGRSFDASNFHKTIWGPARLAIGMPKLTPHGLRHSAGSIMIANGWTAKRVQMELGHHSAAFTLSTYVHEFELREDDPGREQLTEALTRHLAAAKQAATREEVPQHG